MFNIFVQCIGYLGVAGFITSYLQKSRKGIILFTFLARVFFVTHYILLGGYAGAAQNAVGGVASAIAARRGKKPFDSKFTPVLIILLTLTVGFGVIIITYIGDKNLYKALISLLPVVAMVVQNIALWLKKGTMIRIFTLAGIPLWFIYNFLSGSVPAMMSDTLSAISLIVSLVRYDIAPAVKEKHSK